MAKVVTDDNNYKNIANALRKISGGGEQMFAPSQMAEEILKLPVNIKRWSLTIEEDLSYKIPLIKDDWLAKHRADKNLFVFFVKKETVGSERAHGVFIASYCCNTPILKTEVITIYGQSFRKANGSNSYNFNCCQNSMIGTGNMFGGQILIDTDGGLQIECSENYKIIAGEYEVIAWLM